VIGNANYPGNDSVLNYAGNDASDVADGTRRTYLLPIDAQIRTARRAPRSAALHDCNMALQLDPGLAVALDSRGLINLKFGNYAAAIRDYSLSIEANPRSVSSLFDRGIETRRRGGDGTVDLTRAKSMDPNITQEFAGYGVTECAA
jgi:hypothetical protein